MPRDLRCGHHFGGVCLSRSSASSLKRRLAVLYPLRSVSRLGSRRGPARGHDDRGIDSYSPADVYPLLAPGVL